MALSFSSPWSTSIFVGDIDTWDLLSTSESSISCLNLGCSETKSMFVSAVGESDHNYVWVRVNEVQTQGAGAD